MESHFHSCFSRLPSSGILYCDPRVETPSQLGRTPLRKSSNPLVGSDSRIEGSKKRFSCQTARPSKCHTIRSCPAPNLPRNRPRMMCLEVKNRTTNTFNARGAARQGYFGSSGKHHECHQGSNSRIGLIWSHHVTTRSGVRGRGATRHMYYRLL